MLQYGVVSWLSSSFGDSYLCCSLDMGAILKYGQKKGDNKELLRV